MINTGLVVGRVTEVADDRDAVIVVVKTGGGVARGSGKAWEEFAACRFYGDAKKWANGLAPGDLVKVDGSVKSRKSDKGGWFSSFEARYLQKMEVPGAAKHTRVSAPKPADDDDFPGPPF